MFERHASVVVHSKDAWVLVEWECLCVECDVWVYIVFSVEGGDECGGGFGWGDLESISLEPRFKSVYVTLDLCGSGLVFGVVGEYSDVVCIGEYLSVGVCRCGEVV